jgi:hypothetical protein
MGNNNVVSLERAWAIWSDCLRGEDENSIFRQISVMIWDTAIFRFVLESRQTQVEKNPDNPSLNLSLHAFIDRNYFQAQAASIRRLADKSSYGLTGKRGIYSLHSLIDDISKRRLELTREAFFELRHTPYDYTIVQQRERDFIAQQAKESRLAFRIPPEFDWEVSADAHATFDRLCGTSAQNRKHQDVIAEKVFARLKDKLNSCNDVTNYVDKFVAHSATPESRAVANTDSAKITLKHIWDAHQTIYEIAEFLSGVLFAEGHAPLAWKSPNLFDNWETPLLESQHIDRLEKAYQEFEEETNKWQLEVENLWKWIES